MGKVNTWRDKYASKGVCDFDLNYRFYFKWLLNKVASCFVIKGGDNTKVDKEYLKTNLILDGNICITDFRDGIYACIGGLGGQPDEYYCPVNFIIANPILGSKTVWLRDWGDDNSKNGVLISNTAIDKYTRDTLDCGLFTLIHQTATLLADNIVSINCCQINTRVQTLYAADSDTKATEGEAVLKELYAGVPYKIVRQDIREKITVTPTANAGVSQNITELVELHNYIIANFFQSIGIVANNVMKRERLITSEIDSQNAFVNLSLTEMLESWTRGFNAVNELYGTDFEVTLNPTIIETLVESISGYGNDTSDNGVEDVDYDNVVEKEAGNPATDESGQVSNGEEQEPETNDSAVVGESETDTVNSETFIEQAEQAVEQLANYLVNGEVTDEAKEEEGEDEDELQSEDSED